MRCTAHPRSAFYPRDVRALNGLIEVARKHPFSAAQIVLLVTFVACAAVGGFLVHPSLGFFALGIASLVACIVIGQD